MRLGKVPASVVYPTSRFFLDLIDGRPEAAGFFGWRPIQLESVAEARLAQRIPRDALAEVLLAYNRRIGAQPQVEEQIRRLALPGTLAVVGGQQAGFLGGPAYVLYKIQSVVSLASSLTRRLQRPVVPVFWLASEDHDFDEINRVRYVDSSGVMTSSSFESDQRGAAIERLTINREMEALAAELMGDLPEAKRRIFAHEPDDDYASWHARIWTRLFGARGLILVEPRVLRGLMGSLADMARSRTAAIERALRQSAEGLTAAGYDVPLDPNRAGRLFAIQSDGRRVREVDGGIGEASSDVALRPVFADAVLPTLAQVLGPGEIAYHAMLRPLYDLFDVAQPLIISRQGVTVLSVEEADLLRRLDIPLEEALDVSFDPGAALARVADRHLLRAFQEVRERVGDDLRPLGDILCSIDPSLDARVRQTADRVDQEIDRLAERASRAELGRRGISVRGVRALAEVIRPMRQPQERVLSTYEVIRRHGMDWIDRFSWDDAVGCATHHVVAVEGET